jgi:hypothetical protein
MNSKFLALFLGIIFYSCNQSKRLREEPSRIVKTDFSFLIGHWKVDTLINGDTLLNNDDLIKFYTKGRSAISSDWYFNRGSAKKPTYGIGQYHFGYDSISRLWNTYFLTEKTARFYRGSLESGEWWFYYTFYKPDGYEVNQRHVWRPISTERMERLMQTRGHNESKDWITFHYTIFSRTTDTTRYSPPKK